MVTAPTYHRDAAGNLYRRTGARVEIFSRFLADDWTPLLVPLRHATGLRRISRLRATLIVWRRRIAVWRFVRAVGAK